MEKENAFKMQSSDLNLLTLSFNIHKIKRNNTNKQTNIKYKIIIKINLNVSLHWTYLVPCLMLTGLKYYHFVFFFNNIIEKYFQHKFTPSI